MFNKIENKWKLAFFILIGIIAGTLCFIIIRVSTLREPESIIEESTTESTDADFQIQLTKSQTNKLINYYLNEFLSNSNVKYKFVLDNRVLLNGKFSFLGHEMNFYLYFDPYVIDDGEIQLKAKSLSIGTLSLPISEVMKYVKKNYKMPTWVEVDSENEMLILHLNQFKLENGMYFSAERIDLVDDIIQVNVFLPESNSQ